MKYAPLNLGRWVLWSAAALVFLVAPHLFSGGFALTMLTQMGTLILFALSYNMLLGQGGMLSFGHAVYSGLGAYVTVHVLNLMGKGSFTMPLPLLPLVGGVAGLFFGVLFGQVLHPIGLALVAGSAVFGGGRYGDAIRRIREEARQGHAQRTAALEKASA